MKTELQERREQLLWNIGQNPTEITITRMAKVRHKGGFKEEVEEIAPFTGRIFPKARRQPQLQSQTQGTRITDDQWALLADWQADIRCGTEVADEFETPLGRFRVTQIKPQLLFGEVIGYQCDLERVS